MQTAALGRRRFALSALPLLYGCALLDESPQDRAKVSFPILVKVSDESGAAVSNAELIVAKRSVGSTNASGASNVVLLGQPGESVSVGIKCPTGYASPDKPIEVGLKQLNDGSVAPRFEARCTALVHSVVLGIRTDGGAGLPVVYLGKPIGSTDASGTAHVVMQVPPNETISVQLDTRANPLLRPQSPSLTFRTSQRDELILLEQKFSTLPRRVVVHASNRPTPL